ncbi:hypothetical protein ABBQ32_007003 [Trebouxia sp. C0010 RCD-2024]
MLWGSMLSGHCFLYEPSRTFVDVASATCATGRTPSAYNYRYFTSRRCCRRDPNARQLTLIQTQAKRERHMRSAALAENLSLGIDCGTSGARSIVIDGDRKIVFETEATFDKLQSEDWVAPWTRALLHLLKQLPQDIKDQITSLCIDGTSSTALLVDSKRGDILAPTKIYNEDQGSEPLAAIKEIAPEWHCARGSTSTLAKLLDWHFKGLWQQAKADGYSPVLLHHADWLASLLTDRRDTSDWNNTLKLGYDPEAEQWPPWLLSQVCCRLGF